MNHLHLQMQLGDEDGPFQMLLGKVYQTVNRLSASTANERCNSLAGSD